MDQEKTSYKTSLLYLNNESFKELNNKRRRISVGNLGFQRFFDIKNYWSKFSIIFFVAIAMGLINFLLIERSGIYSPGINSCFQAVARLVYVFSKSSSAYSFLFWGLNIIFNVVCAFFCYKTVGKKFTQLTILYITVAALTGLTLSYFQESLGLKDFYIFSHPNSTKTELVNNKINILLWPDTDHTADNYKVIIIFIYGVVFAIINTFASLIIYSLDAGTGGADWLVFHLYKTKAYSSNKLLFCIGLCFVMFAYVFGTYLPYCIKTTNTNIKTYFLNIISPTFLTTIIAIFTKKILFSYYYPQFKFVKTTVFTNHHWEIRKLLLKEKFPHSFTITNSVGSYSLKNQTQLEFICFAIELKELMANIRTIDPDCLIVASPISTLNGHMKMNMIS